MDTQLLRAFISVAQQQSFSLAATELNLTQSAISKRIALLEQQLSHHLFDRIGRKIFLTESGEKLLPRAQAIIEGLEDTVRFIQQQGNDISGELRLATSHHIGIHRLPPILKPYRQRYPKVHLQLHFIDSEQAINSILNHEYDLAVITLPDTLHDDGSSEIQYHHLWEDPMQIVVDPQHPLLNEGMLNKGKLDEKGPNKKHDSQTTIEDLASYPAILPDTSTRTTQLVKRLFSDKQHPLNITMTSNHLDAIKMMVAVGLGWSVLPTTLIDQSVTPIDIKDTHIIRELGCIHHRHRTLSNASRAMLNCLQV